MAWGSPTVRACISQILLFFCLSIFIYILYEKVWLEPGELSYVHVSCCCMGCSFNLHCNYKFIGSFCTSRQKASTSSNLPQ